MYNREFTPENGIVQDIHNRFIDSLDHDADRTEW